MNNEIVVSEMSFDFESNSISIKAKDIVNNFEDLKLYLENSNGMTCVNIAKNHDFIIKEGMYVNR